MDLIVRVMSLMLLKYLLYFRRNWSRGSIELLCNFINHCLIECGVGLQYFVQRLQFRRFPSFSFLCLHYPGRRCAFAFKVARIAIGFSIFKFLNKIQGISFCMFFYTEYKILKSLAPKFINFNNQMPLFLLFYFLSKIDNFHF